MKLLLFLDTPLFLIENMFKGQLNNLHYIVGNKQKLTVCVTVETCAHLSQMAVFYADMPSKSLRLRLHQFFSGLNFVMF